MWTNILWNWWVDYFIVINPSSDVTFWVLIVNPFSLLCSTCFFSRKLCFLRSPCLLLIAESISLDTSGKPNVGFFLKISSSSWIILSISLNELNSNDWLLKRWWWIFLKSFLFYCCKRIFILENLTDNFLNIIVNVNFSGDLKFEYYWALPWNTATNKP